MTEVGAKLGSNHGAAHQDGRRRRRCHGRDAVVQYSLSRNGGLLPQKKKSNGQLVATRCMHDAQQQQQR